MFSEPFLVLYIILWSQQHDESQKMIIDNPFSVKHLKTWYFFQIAE
jgi:uncharacterized membrane protein YbaN (DUF454 family)